MVNFSGALNLRQAGQIVVFRCKLEVSNWKEFEWCPGTELNRRHGDSESHYIGFSLRCALMLHRAKLP